MKQLARDQKKDEFVELLGYEAAFLRVKTDGSGDWSKTADSPSQLRGLDAEREVLRERIEAGLRLAQSVRLKNYWSLGMFLSKLPDEQKKIAFGYVGQGETATPKNLQPLLQEAGYIKQAPEGLEIGGWLPTKAGIALGMSHRYYADGRNFVPMYGELAQEAIKKFLTGA